MQHEHDFRFKSSKLWYQNDSSQWVELVWWWRFWNLIKVIITVMFWRTVALSTEFPRKKKSMIWIYHIHFNRGIPSNFNFNEHRFDQTFFINASIARIHEITHDVHIHFFHDDHDTLKPKAFVICTGIKSHNFQTNEKCSSFELRALFRYVIVRWKPHTPNGYEYVIKMQDLLRSLNIYSNGLNVSYEEVLIIRRDVV